ncbi:MAG: hypothetical protein JNL97_05495, partial [Verrucomicrobiales bacterium]|nr:hypothetical protein [Verrucomicrobiales bacterium]
MNLFLGLDGGGSHTRALVVDATGRRIGRGDSGATNPRHVAEDEARKRLLAAIGKALARVAGGPPDVRSVFVGMAGTTSETGRREVGALVASCG